jgi:hypothetical protein
LRRLFCYQQAIFRGYPKNNFGKQIIYLYLLAESGLKPFPAAF